jgi:RNA polymerase sigma-70 factor, ECF subfamily
MIKRFEIGHFPDMAQAELSAKPHARLRVAATDGLVGGGGAPASVRRAQLAVVPGGDVVNDERDALEHLLALPEGDAGDVEGPGSRNAGDEPGSRGGRPPNADARLRAMVSEHFDFIWRSLRRLGVPHTDVDDCTQQVFWVAARKLAIISEGSERAFLFSTALRVASDARRSRSRRREVQQEDDGHQTCDAGPRPDEIADQKRARALLDDVLSTMPLELRTVFVLFELEELPTQDIAELLGLPTGTVASRLRRAREEFHKLVSRLRHGLRFRESQLAHGREPATARGPFARPMRGGKR